MTARDPLTPDLFDPDAPLPPVPPVARRLVETGTEIAMGTPDRVDFLHAVLCQVGMPRKKTEERVFERWQGNIGLSIEAGRLGLGGRPRSAASSRGAATSTRC